MSRSNGFRNGTSASRSLPAADTAITRISAIFGSRFCSCRRSQPSMPGIIRSSTMRRGGDEPRNCSSARCHPLQRQRRNLHHEAHSPLLFSIPRRHQRSESTHPVSPVVSRSARARPVRADCEPRGRTTTNVDPSPGRLSTAIVPCIASTMRFVNQRRSPNRPYCRPDTALSNRAKSRGCSSGLIPIP